MVVNSLVDMEVATPSELTPAISSVADTVGNIMNLMLGGGGGSDTSDASNNSTDNTTATDDDDPCKQVAIIDKVGFETSCQQ